MRKKQSLINLRCSEARYFVIEPLAWSSLRATDPMTRNPTTTTPIGETHLDQQDWHVILGMTVDEPFHGEW
jgi:hypothetical protein